MGATAEFMDAYRCATFYFTTKQVSEKGENIFSKGTPVFSLGFNHVDCRLGAPFSLLVQRSAEVILRPASFNEPIKVPMRISTTLGVEQCSYNPEFTVDQTVLMQNVVRTRMPPPSFEPVNVEQFGPVIDTDLSRIAHPVMDNLCLSLKAMAPTTMAAYQNKLAEQNNLMSAQGKTTQGNKMVANGTEPIKQDAVKTKISYYINPQYLTKTFSDSVIGAIRSLAVVTDASYLLERHNNAHVMYRLTVEYLDTHFNETPPVAPFVPAVVTIPTGKAEQDEVHYHFTKPTNIMSRNRVD